MERYICIHGHFYQPPRENPWLEEIEIQDSAYPYHDWNDRITAECYEPNATSRIQDGEGRIIRIVNNYANISFNFGPTLLSWLENHAPDTYRRVLEADRDSQRRFSGHGSAMAQVYNHVIMPLANRRDKVTQVKWGIRDFEHRFGRKPEGMWLAETAVDTETLDVLAEQGIKFTVLAPNQAHEVRNYRARTWQDVSGSCIDPTKAYEVRLPSRRRIDVFFYDGPISRAIAFEGLLNKGEYLADRLVGAFADHRQWNQLVNIATDGESYGHHHRQGDMALSYALHHIAQRNLAKLTNFGEYLERNPATDEARIYEDSSWSCVHGVERWRSDCGCNSGGHPGWNQKWRGPLRDALDWLRDRVAPLYEKMGGCMFKDPWAARDAYIEVVLDRSLGSVERFFDQHASHRLGDAVMSNALVLLELQRQCLLMYTSCGWFFDELSGIETVQIVQYAGRAIQLAEYLFEEELEDEFCRRLALAKSNLPQYGDGREIYRKFVKPVKVELEDVGAHFAVSSLFEDYKKQNKIFAYTAEVEDFDLRQTGHSKLATGIARIVSDVTRQASKFSFGVLHLGDHHLHGGIRPYTGPEDYETLDAEAAKLVEQAEFTSIVGFLNREFPDSTFSLRSLFRDEQRNILNMIIDAGPAERAYRELYQRSAPLLHFLASLNVPRPPGFRMAAEFVLNLDLQRAFQGDVTPERIKQLLKEARICGVELDRAGLSYALERRIQKTLQRPAKNDPAWLTEFDSLVSTARLLPFDVNLRPAQNVYYELMQTALPAQCEHAEEGDEASKGWVKCFTELADKLSVRVTLPQGKSLAVT